ncbi:hypothetical protein CKAN_00673900 [Cinnamomum micranthum f. kanehirae]|uniref:Uncharacterized protein n=1 Tax=Cinnamomum micranthum f. kanehirae TaxID=337451 RepID=A0A3S3MZZ1_9MAGN|nr:hypothetical protein CKAN_00673900 [Cinnamomum micranthum f. kanehirae]
MDWPLYSRSFFLVLSSHGTRRLSRFPQPKALVLLQILLPQCHLTLLSVATKLPVYLNTSMPRAQDQLTKLSGTVLICTVMGNFMTLLGTMDGSEMMANIVALGILVVTVIINIGIQMGTGVIYVFLPEHAVIMFLFLVLLVMLCSTAIMIPPARKLLKEQHIQKLSSDEELRTVMVPNSYGIHIFSDIPSSEESRGFSLGSHIGLEDQQPENNFIQ